MSKQHEVENIAFDGDWMILAVDGQVYRLPLSQVSDRLAKASEIDRNLYRIAPSGYGIHWLTLDEDLSIDGLLRLAALQSQASWGVQRGITHRDITCTIKVAWSGAIVLEDVLRGVGHCLPTVLIASFEAVNW